jgi:Xaa-Pro aminopeptidase
MVVMGVGHMIRNAVGLPDSSARASWIGAMAAIFALAAIPARADGPALHEGLAVQHTFLSILFMAVIVIWGLVLLLSGRRLPRFTVGSFLLLAGGAIAMALLASTNYLLALAALFVFMAFGLGVYIYVPRLAMAVAGSWPLPAVYFAVLYFTGSFNLNRPLALGLLGAGVLLGAIFPNFSLALLAPALGTLLLALVWPGEPPMWPVFIVLTLAVLWQAVGLARRRRREPWPLTGPERLKQKREDVLQSVRWAAGILAALFVVTALLAPQPKPVDDLHAKRLGELSKKGGLQRPGFLLSAENAYYLFGRPVPVSLVGQSRSFWNRFTVLALGRSPSKDLHALRAVKDAGEIEKMRRAADITSKAFEVVAPMIHPGATEADLERAILDTFHREGATGIAFRCIVGSGPNAVNPHYMANDGVLKEGFVVIDIGCSVDNYASDMTRTFPVTGTFSPAEAKLAEIVMKAHEAARLALKPGAHYSDLDRKAHAIVEKAGFGPYFNHGLGHPVGIDVHDPYVEVMKPGMVMTIEPGIYVPEGADVDKAYWNLGIRVEDSYLVTADGCEALTHFPQPMPPEEKASGERTSPETETTTSPASPSDDRKPAEAAPQAGG